MIKAIIVEDNADSLRHLKSILSEFCPQVEVTGTTSGVVAAAKIIKQDPPDLIFLDIELEDGSGFDLLEILTDIHFKVIFITGSDQHAIRAFRFSAIDYLLKPVKEEELVEAVEKVHLRDSADNVEVLLEAWQENHRIPRITLRNSDEIKIISVDQIIRCESDSSYTTFHFIDGSRFLVSKTLKSYSSLLLPFQFMRVHQSHLVNLNQVQSYMKADGGYLLMSDGSEIPVAIRKRAQLSRWLARGEV